MTGKTKILLVDDSPIIRHVGNKILTKKGFEVLQADNGSKALDALRNNHVSLIVLDYYMPVLDGLQTLREIRRFPYKEKSGIPVIILSGEDNPAEISKLIEAGANDFINKLKLKATPEIFLEKVFGLLNHQKEVEYYKRMKLSHTLCPEVKEFKKYVDDCVNKYFQGETLSFDELEAKIITEYNNVHEGNVTEIIYDIPSPDDFIATHSVNSCFLTLMFGIYQQWEKEVTLNAAMAALFHDFGNLSKEVYSKESVDYEHYKKHIDRSIDFVRKSGLPDESLQIIANHHERVDGSGYPKQKKGDELDKISQIVSIIDTFDTLTTQIGLDKKMMVKDALRRLLSWENQFSPALLKDFNLFSMQFEFKPND
ncbi:MAG: response regulator [Nitrospinae bacterium]|nr:response regulator [Nitrospinota bacterium]